MGKVQLDGILKLVDVQINPQVFRKISQATAGMPASLKGTNKQLQGAATNAGILNKKLKGTAVQLNANQKAARLLLQRMAQFAILLPTFATLNRAIQGSVKFLFEFDGALRDIVRIDISGLKDRMEEVGEAALQTATEFGVTGTEVLNTTRIFKQAGFEIEESQEKARAAILATQISTLTSTQATEVFIAAQKQFGKEGENSISVLDKLAKVEDLAAVNAGDVADAFRTGGNALATFSQSIDDSVGLISALREQTRKSGREIGTFFKTLQTRIFAAGDARSAIEGLGIEVENLDGSLRPTLQVLNELKGRFDELTDAQKANAAKSIAGIRQFESLIATLNSLDRANELSAASSEAAGTADEKRVITDAKLERQLGKLIAQGQAFAEALGDAGIEDTLEKALKSAAGLLKIFTSLVDTVGDLGGNLTPLLALAGLQGAKILGFAGGTGKAQQSLAGPAGRGTLSGGGVTSVGATSQIAGFGKFKTAIGLLSTDMKNLAPVVSNTTKFVSEFGRGLLVTSQSTKSHGFVVNQDAAALKKHAAAIKLSAQAAVAGRKNVLSGSAAMIGLTLAATALPAAFDAISKKAREGIGGELGEATGQFIDITGSSATMAAQFAILGPQAAAVAGIFGALKEAGPGLVNAFIEQKKAIEEETNINLRQGRVEAGAALLSGSQGGGAQREFLSSLADSVANVDLGNDLNAAIQESINTSALTDSFKKLGISGEDLSDSLFQNVNTIKAIVDSNGDFIESVALSEDRLELFTELQKGLADGTLNSAEAFGLLVRALGAGAIEIDEVTGELKRALTFKEFKASQRVLDLADNIRTLSLELELAQAGPDALADSLVRVKNEFLLVERESTQSLQSLQDELGNLFSNIGGEGFAVGLRPGETITDFFKTVEAGVNTLDPKKIQEFRDFIQKLGTTQKTAAAKLESIFERTLKTRLALQNKENEVTEETSRQAKALLETQQQAALNAFSATQKFNAELKKFGSTVTTDVLKAFQSVTSEDIDKVLSGQSDLSQGVQDLITGAFAGPIEKAQVDLQAVTASTEAQLSILARRLEEVTTKINEEATSQERAGLIAQQRSIQLEMETTQQNALIKTAEGKIKVLEAEREVAEDLREAEAKRADLMLKLADASRDFDKTLRKIEEDFADFSEQKISDLLKDEADARSDLKEAQKETLDSTKALAEAYMDLQQAQLEFNGALAEAQLKSNLLSRDIAMLTGEVVGFDQQLGSLGGAFASVLSEANISLEKRISLERQLAEDTLSFLQQSRDSIVQAGIGIFGQSAGENQALGQGIEGLQFIADQLGGSFESFLNLTQGELSNVSQTLLGLPTEFRQQILSALSFLPSTTDIGGFSPEQLREAIGQVGAGVSPEAGLPSIEELNGQQVEQLTRLQELAIQDAQLQISQVIAAQEQLLAAEEAVEAAKLIEERARESLGEVRDAVLEEKAVLDLANDQRQELLAAVVEADDRNTLLQIEKEAQLFAEQNKAFREVGDQIVQGISSAISGRLAAIEAAANVASASRGFIPNFASGNLSPSEAAGLLRAGAREKRAMPGGAGLAVANTSEAVIPMRNRGFVPNFQDGNTSPISAGISAVKQINETVVAAIARSVTAALTDLQGGGGGTEELLQEVVGLLSSLNSTLDSVDESNSLIQSSSSSVASNTATTDTAVAAGGQDVRITLQTQQNNTVSVTGLESLRTELEEAMRGAANDQVTAQIDALLEQIDSVFTSLQERGLISSFGQSR